jgi:hypothetical protein
MTVAQTRCVCVEYFLNVLASKFICVSIWLLCMRVCMSLVCACVYVFVCYCVYVSVVVCVCDDYMSLFERLCAIMYVHCILVDC